MKEKNAQGKQPVNDHRIKEFVFRKGAAGRIPVSGTFELTPRCNFSCRMCYIRMSAGEQAACGRELTAGEWIDLGREAAEQGMIYLLLTGGEPLLRPDFVEIYTALVQKGLLMTVNTNAALLTDGHVECFLRHRPEKVNVTLYGMSPQTYASLCGRAAGFAETMDGIRMLKEAGIRLDLNTTFTKLNAQDMEQLVAYARGTQIPVRMAGFVFPPVRNAHEPDGVSLSPGEMGALAAKFDALTLEPDKLERRRSYIQNCFNGEPDRSRKARGRQSACMAGRGAFWITWDGRLCPCGMLPDMAQDVRTAGFSAAWEAACARVDAVRLPRECTRCSFQHICPTCAAVSLSVCGRTDQAPESLCQRTRAYAANFLSL